MSECERKGEKNIHKILSQNAHLKYYTAKLKGKQFPKGGNASPCPFSGGQTVFRGG